MTKTTEINPADYTDLEPLINNLSALFLEGFNKATSGLADQKRDLALISLIIRVASSSISSICQASGENQEQLLEDIFSAIRDTTRLVEKKNAERLESAKIN